MVSWSLSRKKGDLIWTDVALTLQPMGGWYLSSAEARVLANQVYQNLLFQDSNDHMQVFRQPDLGTNQMFEIFLELSTQTKT